MATAASPTRAIVCFTPARFESVSNTHGRTHIGVSSLETLTSALGLRLKRLSWKPTRLKAALNEIEPDLQEDPVDRWRTNGVDPVSLLTVYFNNLCLIVTHYRMIHCVLLFLI
jgi:hypothetical protein